MLSFAIIVFREVLEIALVVGVLLAATRGVVQRNKWVWVGMVAGIVGSLVVAFFAEAISNAMEGMGQEVFNATVLFLAALLIGWTVVWMRRHAKVIVQEIKNVSRAVVEGVKPLYSLAVVIALTVLRDGSETVMFTYGSLATGENALNLVMGSLLGIVTGTAVGVALYYGILRISPGKIFGATSWMLMFLAAGMVSQAVGFLSSAGVVPEIIYPVWDTSWIIPNSSFIGTILNTLVGYTDRPSAMQLIGYVLTFVGIAAFLKFYGNGPVPVVSTAKPLPAANQHVTVGLILCLCILGSTQEAVATKKVYSPLVEEGELEFEMRGGYDFDDRASKDGKQVQKYAVGYGVTDRWFTELYGEIEQGATEDNFDFTAIEWENRYQLFDQGQYWLDAGLYFAYENSFEAKHADKIEGKLLLEKPLVHFTHTVNLELEQEVGQYRTKDVKGATAWSSRYRWKESLEPGIEWHADFGELNAGNSFDEQTHQLGPVFYGKLFDHFKYDIGYLFGVSDAAPDGTLKWILEYEIHI